MKYVLFICLALTFTVFSQISADAQEQNAAPAESETQIIIIDSDYDSSTGTQFTGSVTESRSPEWRKRASLSARGGMIVNTAKKFIGVPYRWGGTSSNGFDCSGFIKSVYAAHGLDVKRMADEQYFGGTKVKREDLITGDLVFFSTYLPGVSHVGIYIGDNKFIHSSSSRGVTIDSLDSGYYKSCYVGACRY